MSPTLKTDPSTQNAIQSLIGTIGGLLSGLSPVAKAVTAAVIPTVSSLVNMAFAGSFDTTSIVVLVTGLIGSLGVYLVPNRAQTPAVATVPVPVPVSPVVKKPS